MIFKPTSSRSVPDFSGFSSGEFDRSKMRNRNSSDSESTNEEETKVEEKTEEKQD